MIQRIQSLYLLLITALLIAVLFLPFGVFQTSHGAFEYTAFSIGGDAGKLALPLWFLPILSILSAALAFVTIFLFKKRKIQIRLCLLNSLLMVSLSLVVAVILFLFKNNSPSDFAVGFGLPLPMISIILNFMAIKAIRKDESLVKSWDRMR
ncbi:MAG TPA: DUF4293 domain-containing protein [Bacteroidales bacterium]